MTLHALILTIRPTASRVAVGHLATNAAGRPLRLIMTEGQAADISCVAELIEGLRVQVVIADKGLDANAFMQSIRAAGVKAVIPHVRTKSASDATSAPACNECGL